MRLSPLVLTIILALLTGAVAIGIWALLADHFNPLGTLVGGLNITTAINITDYALIALKALKK
jgi:uncharacterized membrane protein YdfJ with MMPL/SSD domain